MFISRLTYFNSKKERVWEGYPAVLKVSLLTEQVPGKSCKQRPRVGNSFVPQNTICPKAQISCPRAYIFKPTGSMLLSFNPAVLRVITFPVPPPSCTLLSQWYL